VLPRLLEGLEVTTAIDSHVSYACDGYCPYLHNPMFRPCSSFYRDDIWQLLKNAMSELMPRHELLAASACSSDMLNQVHGMTACFGGSNGDGAECLDLCSAGGRGLAGATCLIRSSETRVVSWFDKKKVLCLLGPPRPDFAEAWCCDDVQQAFVDFVRDMLLSRRSIKVLMLELAPVYVQGACLTRGTLKAIASACRDTHTALVVDDVMLGVRCGRPCSADWVRGFEPDAVITGTKALGVSCLMVRRESVHRCMFTDTSPTSSGQEISAADAHATIKTVRYLLDQKVMDYILSRGEEQRIASKAGGVGYLWYNVRMEFSHRHGLTKFMRDYNEEHCQRLLLPLDYKFPDDYY
jgi:hypothetical protein